MYRMAVLAMCTSDARLDVPKCVMMCVVHDLAEAQVGDITPREGISKDEKRRLESEYEEQQTKEARFVKDLDRLEMALQDTNYRMGQRPVDVNEGEGVGFQDFESSFVGQTDAGTSTLRTSGKPSASRFKPGAFHSETRTLSRASSYNTFTSDDDGSPDELLLSQGSETSLCRPVSKRKPAASRSAAAEDTVRVHVNGKTQNLPCHPDFRPNDRLKGLKFTKKKKKGELEPEPDIVEEGELPAPSSSFPDLDPDESQDIFKPISDELRGTIAVDTGTPANVHSRPERSQASTMMRRKSPSLARSSARSVTDNKRPPNTKGAAKPSPVVENESMTKPSRPKPRVIHKPSRCASPRSIPQAVASTSTSMHSVEPPFPTKSPTRLDTNATNKTKPKPRPRIKLALAPTESVRRVPQGFPMSSAKENVSDGEGSIDHRPTKSKDKEKEKALAPQTSIRSVPLPSPLRNKSPSPSLKKAKPLQPESTFPVLSPLSSPVHRSKTSNGRGKGRAQPGEETPRAPPITRTSTATRPFPMSAQLLESINCPSPSGSLAKRTSDGSDAETGRVPKKRRDSVPAVSNELDCLDDFAMEDDSIDVGYGQDPSTLCPYCDEQLPPYPTPSLQCLLSNARRQSYADARLRNPRGLKAPLAIYISVCQRHRFETHQLPIALERGWPQVIDFRKVPMRVKRMKAELEAIILKGDPLASGDDEDDDDRTSSSRSVFWREVMKEVKKQGSRVVVGVKGQYASFEKTQPGYYGEQGSVIIHQTLFNLFPPSSFDSSHIAPLTPAEFIQRVLVPEAAARLIAQDLCIDMDDAIATLRESAQYGVAMFPDAGVSSGAKGAVADEDDEEMGVADQIVMERARARRKELEEEERVEEEMIREEAENRDKMRREWAIDRALHVRKTREAAAESDDMSSHSEASTRSRTSRRVMWAKQKATAATGIQSQDSESDAMTVDNSTSKRSTRAAVKKSKRILQERPPKTFSSQAIQPDDDECLEVDTAKLVKTRYPDGRSFGQTGGCFTSSIREVDDDDSTPRPHKHRVPSAATNSPTLERARNRVQNSGGWHLNLRSDSPDYSDERSDASTASRRSRPVVRTRKETFEETRAWLLRDSSESSSGEP
ncbi:hypothetical protein ID866_8406 [Astraeus odoratus]|nr:hypothetical protein ID866_8406 [Astraeus odoratus]